jgi:hypothetical protein
MSEMPQGPLFQTQRVEIPGTGTYVEIRQVSWTKRITWEIELGTTRHGFVGAWGRDNVREARICFADAVAYQSK